MLKCHLERVTQTRILYCWKSHKRIVKKNTNRHRRRNCKRDKLKTQEIEKTYKKKQMPYLKLAKNNLIITANSVIGTWNTNKFSYTYKKKNETKSYELNGKIDQRQLNIYSKLWKNWPMKRNLQSCLEM